MLTNIRYILLTALRDRLFIGLLVSVLLAAGVSATLGSTALIEEKEMTVTFAAGAARLILMIGLIVFTCFHIRHAFDTKEIDVILSRPISRTNLIISYWLGFAAVASLLVIPVIALIAFIGADSLSGFAGWALTLLCELLVVVALALFSAFTMRSAVTAVVSCMGIYVLSRMMAFFVITAQTGMGLDKLAWAKYVLIAISTVVPRLDFFAKTQWLVYGFDSSWEWINCALQTAAFVPLLLLAAIIDFRRKQF